MITMKNKIIAVAFLGLMIVLLLALNFSVPSADKRTIHTEEAASEIEEIVAINNLEKRVGLYQKLIKRVGLDEAQEALFLSGLPFTGETHLLNHESGNFAYGKYGNKGLLHCKDYFLASCYHATILSTIAHEGVEALKETMGYCFEKGTPVASQCAHGMGHGFVAWFGYKNLIKALETCDMMQKDDPRFPLFNCHDGVFMENLWGVHEDGTLSADRWLNNNDPYYPCTDPRVKKKWQQGCWSNQAHVMFQMFYGDITKVAEHCNAVENNSYKKICFDSLARQVHPITEGSIDKTMAYCSIFPQEWNQLCLITIVKADFSVGGRELSYEICDRITYSDSKKECYRTLFGTIRAYYPEKIERQVQCDLVKDREYRKECYTAM